MSGVCREPLTSNLLSPPFSPRVRLFSALFPSSAKGTPAYISLIKSKAADHTHPILSATFSLYAALYFLSLSSLPSSLPRGQTARLLSAATKRRAGSRNSLKCASCAPFARRPLTDHGRYHGRYSARSIYSASSQPRHRLASLFIDLALFPLDALPPLLFLPRAARDTRARWQGTWMDLGCGRLGLGVDQFPFFPFFFFFLFFPRQMQRG